MELCQKPWVTTKNSQLLDKFFSGPLNRDNIDKKWQKSPILNEKIGSKTIFGHFGACHQFSTNFDHILHIYREKMFI